MPFEGGKSLWINCNRRSLWRIEAPRCNKLPLGKSFPQRNLLPAWFARFFIRIGCSFDCFSKRPSGSRLGYGIHCEFGQSLGLIAIAVRDESLRHFAPGLCESRA